jgi:hypothetical protein
MLHGAVKLNWKAICEVSARATAPRCFYNRAAQRNSSREYPDFLPFSTATTFAGIGLFVRSTVSLFGYSHRRGKAIFLRARESRWTLLLQL